VRIVVAFAASLAVGWALGAVGFANPEAWPYLGAFMLVGLLLPFWPDRTEQAWRAAAEDRWSELKRAVKTAWDRQA
jgi:hypothetical protein